MKRPRAYLRGHWRLLAAVLAGLVTACSLLIYKLGSLTGGLSQDERVQQAFAGSWHHLVHDPLDAPLTVVQWLLLTVFPHHGHTTTRLPSVLFGFLTLLAFVYVLRRWYGTRTALFGAVIFGTTSWFLHVSRYGGVDVLYLWAIPTLLAAHIIWERHKRLPVNFLIVAILAALLYIPGMLWLIIVSVGLQSSHLRQPWRRLSKHWQRLLLALLFVVLLAPLIYAFIGRPELITTWLGLPANFTHPAEIPRRLVETVGFFVWRGPLQPALWLDRLPILSIFSVVMLVLGAYFYGRHLSAGRTRLLAGLFVIGAVFYAFGGPIRFSLLVPIVYFVVIGGIGYLLHEWLRIFPRNPLARATGYSLLCLAIILSCTYNLRAYFVAWPHNPLTVAAYRQTP